MYPKKPKIYSVAFGDEFKINTKYFKVVGFGNNSQGDTWLIQDLRSSGKRHLVNKEYLESKLQRT